MYLDESGLNSKLKGLWLMLKNQDLMSHISLDNIREIAQSKGIPIIDLKEVDFGYQQRMKGVLLESEIGKIILPRTKIEDVKIYQANIEPIKKTENIGKLLIGLFLYISITKNFMMHSNSQGQYQGTVNTMIN